MRMPPARRSNRVRSPSDSSAAAGGAAHGCSGAGAGGMSGAGRSIGALGASTISESRGGSGAPSIGICSKR